MGSTSIPVGSYSAAIVSVFSNDDPLLGLFFSATPAIDRLLSRAYVSHLAADIAERLAIDRRHSVIQH